VYTLYIRMKNVQFTQISYLCYRVKMKRHFIFISFTMYS